MTKGTGVAMQLIVERYTQVVATAQYVAQCRTTCRDLGPQETCNVHCRLQNEASIYRSIGL